MLRFFLRRSLRLAATLAVSAILVFVALRVIPGDPAQVIAGIDAKPEDIERIRRSLGTDKSLGAQMLAWFGSLVNLDLGVSLSSGEPVIKMIAGRLPVTLGIALAAMLVSILIALPLGVAAGKSPEGSPVGLLATAISQVGISIPGFWLGILLLMLFAVQLRLFPLFGADSPLHFVLPSLALGIGHAAVLLRMTRASTQAELSKGYVLAARARGLESRAILRRHVLKNALPPVITLAALQFGGLLGGAIVIEQVFAIPGMGRLLLTAINQRDFNVVQGCVLCLAAAFSVTGWLADILVAAANPRVVLE
jgi:ABC-type dipeptide/oligopeptide/nickel transport systems, permease components